MKESGMEKLIELLSEYEKKRIEKINSEGKLMVNLSFNPYTEESLTNEAYRSCWLEICSKYYGFIKWLVENDKISNDGIKPRTDLVKEITIVDYKTGDAIGWKNKYTEVEQLIMYLSIQDEPIRFLCEIIK